tara:strand:- start:922 stop:1314 length:393 start_codon:yes stop_codon:yes gene_type:complete
MYGRNKTMSDKQEINIDEYDEFDFGFSTVDESEVQEYESTIRSKVAEESANISSELENKINALLQVREGETTRVQEIARKRKEDLLKVEKMIMPLLYNLMKNPEDVYIKWPNRKEVIDKQIKKIVAITRS